MRIPLIAASITAGLAVYTGNRPVRDGSIQKVVPEWQTRKTASTDLAQRPPVDECGGSEQKVIGGKLDGSKPVTPAVAIKLRLDSVVAATMWKVGPHEYLTAAHEVTTVAENCSDLLQPYLRTRGCKNPGAARLLDGFQPGNGVYLSGGTSPAQPDFKRSTISSVEVHPSWMFLAGDYYGDNWRAVFAKSGGPPRDIALVRLKETNDIPIGAIGGFNPSDTCVSIVGYGCEDHNQVYSSGNRRKSGRARLVSPRGTAYSAYERSYVLTAAPAVNQAATPPRGTAGICPGDSGGPVIQRGAAVALNSQYDVAERPEGGESMNLHLRLDDPAVRQWLVPRLR